MSVALVRCLHLRPLAMIHCAPALASIGTMPSPPVIAFEALPTFSPSSRAWIRRRNRSTLRDSVAAMADDQGRYALARAVVIGAAVVAFALLAATAALVLEYGDARSANNYSLGSIMYLFVGAVIVVIGLIAGAEPLSRPDSAAACRLGLDVSAAARTIHEDAIM